MSGPVEEGRPADRTTPAEVVQGSNDVTVAAVGTSLTWCTGNDYGRKFPDLVHRDLNGDYPLEEKYLHFNEGGGGPGGGSDPIPQYYQDTTGDGYTGAGHPRGPHIPPSQYRARGGAIIGLSPPAKVKFGNKTMSDVTHNQQGGYFWNDPAGSYDGKVNQGGHFSSVVSSFVNNSDVNSSEWLLMRDIGWSWPTIIDQIQQFDPSTSFSAPAEVPGGSVRQFGGQVDRAPPAPEDVDLLLIDGGTNDMQLGWLNNPLSAGRHRVWQAVRLYQYRNMTGPNGLLQRARRKFPNAVIVLVGAPVWASNRTNYRKAASFLIAKNSLAGIAPAKIAESAIDNALNFSHFSPYWLRRAVAEEARDDDGPGMVFAPPGYGIVNAMMSDWPWSFGYTPTGLKDGYSPDDTASPRRSVCNAVRAHQGNTGEREEVGTVKCTAASIGHPNNEGCRQYADTILRRYKERIDLPVSDIADDLDGGTDSLKETLGRYRFDPAADGVNWPLSHRYVDSMRVRINTASGALMGREKGEVWLVVYPGRTGNGERFRLDTERRDTRPGGPKSIAARPFVRPKDEFYIDPMLDRWLEGDVGNYDGTEFPERTKFVRNEPRGQRYRPGGTDRRLRLSDVRHATLETVDVDENDGWNINRVRFSINGSLSRTRSFSFFDNKDVRSGNDPKWEDREFLLTSFNHADGVGPGNFRLEVLDNTITYSGSADGATLSYQVLVRNDSKRRVPDVAIQYGLRAKNVAGTFTGRNWQVERLGDFAPGQSRRPRVSVSTDAAGHIKTNNQLRLYALLGIDGQFKSDYAQTRKGKI